MTKPSDSITTGDEADRFAPGSYGCHEAFHMAGVFADLISDRLCEHPAVMRNPRWQALARRAHHSLFRLYQEMGQEHMKEDGNARS